MLMGHAKFAKVTFHAAITPALAAMFGGAVACKDCASERQQIFSGELTLAFPGIERVNFAPVYICADSLVCLDCGYTELVIPATKLEQLKKVMEPSRSWGA
jgi:hypothetical protein